MWIFGYGSLVWKVDFPYTQKIIGYIKGYERRFWQASIDHRGTPEKPGRVVTLVPSSDTEAKVWGLAYEIPEDDKTVMSLNTREKRFSHVTLPFFPDNNSQLSFNHNLSGSISCLTFIGDVGGPLYLGPAPLEKMVAQIATAGGPSGSNSEYIFQLADWHRTNLPGVEDEHLFLIETELRAKLKPDSVCTWGAAYKLDDDHLEETLRHLDHREVMGYEKVPILFHPVAGHPLNEVPEQPKEANYPCLESPFSVTMYYGSRENEHFVGEAPLETISLRIWESVGPSGANKDYLFNLCNAMRQIKDLLPGSFTSVKSDFQACDILDAHLLELEATVRSLDISLQRNQS